MPKSDAPRMAAPSADRRPIPHNIVEHLQGLILQGSLKIGERLPAQRDMAERLGVSRPSLREALTVLETMGLVTVRPGSGVFVADPAVRAPLWRYADRCTPRDVYEARLGIEGFAARLAAARVGPDEAARLWSQVDAIEESHRRNDILGMARADQQFHDLIFELSGNPMLAAMYRPVQDMAEASRILPMSWRERLGETPREHRAITERLVANDAAGSERTMQDHIAAAAVRAGVALARPAIDAVASEAGSRPRPSGAGTKVVPGDAPLRRVEDGDLRG